MRASVLAAIERVCDSQRFIGGPEVDALEHELAAMLGVKYAIGPPIEDGFYYDLELKEPLGSA